MTLSKLKKFYGVDKINFSNYYEVSKIKAKNKSFFGYPDSFLVLPVARVGTSSLDDWDNGELTLYFVGIFSKWDYFRTSQIVYCYDTSDGFVVETENSFYELKKVG